jgi:hypothetical protein
MSSKLNDQIKNLSETKATSAKPEQIWNYMAQCYVDYEKLVRFSHCCELWRNHWSYEANL